MKASRGDVNVKYMNLWGGSRSIVKDGKPGIHLLLCASHGHQTMCAYQKEDLGLVIAGFEIEITIIYRNEKQHRRDSLNALLKFWVIAGHMEDIKNRIIRHIDDRRCWGSSVPSVFQFESLQFTIKLSTISIYAGALHFGRARRARDEEGALESSA